MKNIKEIIDDNIYMKIRREPECKMRDASYYNYHYVGKFMITSISNRNNDMNRNKGVIFKTIYNMK